jgi:cell division protein FtsL
MSKNTKIIIGVIVVAVLAVLGFSIMNAPDQRTGGEKVGDAVDALSEGQGIDEATEELQDQTTGEQVQDAAEEAVDAVQENVQDAADAVEEAVTPEPTPATEAPAAETPAAE